MRLAVGPETVAGSTEPSMASETVPTLMAESPWSITTCKCGVGCTPVAPRPGVLEAMKDGTAGMVIGIPLAAGPPKPRICPAIRTTSRNWMLLTYPETMFEEVVNSLLVAAGGIEYE